MNISRLRLCPKTGWHVIRSLGAFMIVLVVVFAGRGQLPDDYREPKPLNLASSVHPDAAKASGLGGKIWVHVSVDTDGKVTWKGETEGPDWICSSVKTPDVLALREAARDAAVRSTFYPATKNGKPVKVDLWMTFVYPDRNLTEQLNRERAIEEALDKGLPLPEKEKTLMGGVLNGKAKSLASPFYPPEARKLGYRGAVKVDVLIDTDGKVFAARAFGPHKSLTVAARDAACRSKFTPTLLDGVPVRVSGTINYNFVP